MISERIAKRLRNTMRDRKLTVSELASIAGVSYQTINRLKKGTSGANIESIDLVSKALGVSIDFFLVEENNDEILAYIYPRLSEQNKRIIEDFARTLLERHQEAQ